jgi:flagellar hook-length control protein FliK
MSVSASPPAAPPAPGSSSATGTTGTGVVGQAAHANGPVTGFEALLAAFFGGQDATGAAAASATGAASLLAGKLAGAIAPGDKLAGSDGKTKTGDDAKATAADGASAALDAAQTGLVPPSISALLLVPTPPPTKTDAAAAQPGAAPAVAGGSDKTGGQAAAATLAQLGAPAIGDANTATTPSAAVQTALAAGTLAADAAANAKVPTPTPTPAPAPPATPPAPQIQAQPAIAEAAVPPPPAPTAALTPPAPNSGTKAAPEAGAKAQAAKSTRVEGARVDAAAPNVNLAAKAANAVQAVSGGSAKGEADNRDPQAAVPDAKAGPADGTQTQASLDTASTTTPATLVHAAAVAVRGAPQTVANLAAEIAKKLDGRSTRFDVQLDPAGLGRVDVRVQIGADGKMSASMSFDNPQAAAELKSRAGELHKALEQSGFDLSGGLSFDVAGDNGQGRQAQGQDTDSNTGAAFRGRAFQTALDTTADAAPSNQLMFRQSSASGVDIRI